MYKIILGGAMKGTTKILNGYKFVNGEYTLGRLSPAQLTDSQGAVMYFGKCYQAQLVWDASASTGKPTGERPQIVVERVLSAGDGSPDAADARMVRIKAALLALDPDNDEHWTQAGLPTVQAIEQALDDPTINRRDIEDALPDYERPGRN